MRDDLRFRSNKEEAMEAMRFTGCALLLALIGRPAVVPPFAEADGDLENLPNRDRAGWLEDTGRLLNVRGVLLLFMLLKVESSSSSVVAPDSSCMTTDSERGVLIVLDVQVQKQEQQRPRLAHVYNVFRSIMSLTSVAPAQEIY